jgi:UDP-N-acetylglucosamine 2-epimerase (non-hydrolysing)
VRLTPIWIVIGTRPEAIKLAPVVHALEACGLPPLLVVTGQHPALDLQRHGLAGRPALHLGCQGRADPHAYTGDVSHALTPLLLGQQPSLLLVQGDTSSALGGALAGFLTGTPVGHVEAGLRTFDPAMPWPEEDNRVAIDASADLLFAPTELSAANLRAEGVAGTIHVTGNTAIDALAALVGPSPQAAARRGQGEHKLLVTCHRRENWGAAFLPIALALQELAEAGRRQIDVVLHPNPAQADTMRRLLANRPAIRLLAPMEHWEIIDAMKAATLVLSDSGGIQEEAPSLGVPLLVLREKTERPEGIATGNMLLVGTATDRIVTEANRLLSDPAALAAMSRPALPYGDGHAAARIAALIADWIAARDRRETRLIA